MARIKLNRVRNQGQRGLMQNAEPLRVNAPFGQAKPFQVQGPPQEVLPSAGMQAPTPKITKASAAGGGSSGSQASINAGEGLTYEERLKIYNRIAAKIGLGSSEDTTPIRETLGGVMERQFQPFNDVEQRFNRLIGAETEADLDGPDYEGFDYPDFDEEQASAMGLL